MFVQSASVIASQFMDTGLFGLKVQGPGSHSVNILSAILEQMHGLRLPIPEAELARHKNLVKHNILAAMEKQEQRLEEMARNYMTFGELNLQNYCANVDKVTSQDINRVAIEMLKGKPTLTVTGSNVNETPSIEQCMHALN